VSPARRPFRGWLIVAAAFVAMLVAYGAQYSFGVFFAAMLDEFRWTRASLAGAFALYTVVYTAFGFVAGRLTDRWGPRVVMTVGSVLLGSGLAGMAAVSAQWHPYLLYGVVAALGMSTVYIPCSATVVKWFVRQRGLAMGIATSGGSVGTLVLPVVAQAAIGAIGWRWAYVVLGAAIVVVLPLVGSVMRRSPEDVGLHPDGAPTAAARGAAGRTWSLRGAMRTSAFWVIFWIFTATWTPVFIPMVHLVPFARDIGLSPLIAATVVSALGLSAIIGRVTCGAISDRLDRRHTLRLGLALQVLAFAGLAMVSGPRGLYAAAVLFGVSYGAVSVLFPALIGDFFGRDQAGTIVGFVFAVAGGSTALGTIAAGRVYDASGSYALAFLGSAALNAIALALTAGLRAPGPRYTPSP
jgi:MFS family permease